MSVRNTKAREATKHDDLRTHRGRSETSSGRGKTVPSCTIDTPRHGSERTEGTVLKRLSYSKSLSQNCRRTVLSPKAGRRGSAGQNVCRQATREARLQAARCRPQGFLQHTNSSRLVRFNATPSRQIHEILGRFPRNRGCPAPQPGAAPSLPAADFPQPFDSAAAPRAKLGRLRYDPRSRALPDS